LLGAFFVVSMLLGAGVASRASELAGSPAPAATTSPAPVASVDPAVTARAKEWLHRIQTGDIDRSQLTSAMSGALTPDVVKQVSEQLSSLGDPQTFSFVSQQSLGDGIAGYVYRVTFKSSSIDELIALDKNGKIAALRFRPVQP
jgi:hypothetical protein